VSEPRRDFLRLFWAATITNFGSMITQLALPFAAIQTLRAGAAELAVLRACVLLPGFALGLLAGAWLDRLRRRPVLVASDLLRAALYASVAVFAAAGTLQIAHLYAVGLGAGLLSFLFHVARDAYVPALVPRSGLVAANARIQAGEGVSEGVGFGAGGWLVQLLGAPQALLVDATTFVASGALLARIRTPEPAPERRGGARPARAALREVAEGLRFVARHPVLLPLAASGALLALGWQVTSVVQLLFLDQLGFAAGWLGLVFAAGSASSLLGALTAARAGRRLGAGASMAAGLAVLGAGMLAVPLVQGPGAVGFALLVAQQLGDGGAVVYGVHEASLRQASAPRALRTRVNACFSVSAQGAMLAGSALGGALGEAVGARATLVAGAAFALVAALVVALSRAGSVREIGGGPERRRARRGSRAEAARVGRARVVELEVEPRAAPAQAQVRRAAFLSRVQRDAHGAAVEVVLQPLARSRLGDAGRAFPQGPRITGTRSWARAQNERFQGAAPASRYSGKRRSSSSKAIRASRRARPAPRQKCAPYPKARWR
jgi:MFS family permease